MDTEAASVISSFGNHGIAGLIILVVLVILFGAYKLANKWIETTTEREKRDADIRKDTCEALKGLTVALAANTEAARSQAAATARFIETVGRLPCTLGGQAK